MEDTPRNRISRQAILIRIKVLLADIAGLTPRDIKADQELAKSPLNYAPPAKLGLARRLNEAFSDWALEVKPIHTAACVTVRDLRIAVESDLVARGVEVTGLGIFGNLSHEN